MAGHGMALNLPLMIVYFMKYSMVTVKAFDHDLMTITVLDVFGCTDSRVGPWDSLCNR